MLNETNCVDDLNWQNDMRISFTFNRRVESNVTIVNEAKGQSRQVTKELCSFKRFLGEQQPKNGTGKV